MKNYENTDTKSKKLEVILLSDLQYPKGELPSYLFEVDKQKIISDMYDAGVFVWDDFIDVLADDYEPDIFYKYKTGRTRRPYIPFTQQELNYALSSKGQTEIEIVYVTTVIKKLLTSRNFTAARKLLPLLGKLDNSKDKYAIYEEPCPNCILLRHFQIQKPDDKGSLKINTSKHR